jgi:hypothetical protein
VQFPSGNMFLYGQSRWQLQEEEEEEEEVRQRRRR